MNEAVANFYALERRLRFVGTLTTRTALRIGSGGAGELDGVDLPVLRDASGFPFIPGSSLKGALRSTIEALVRGARHERSSGIWACNPLAEKAGSDCACGYHDQGKRAEAEKNVAEHCAVCRIFGSRIVASHVRITDAMIHAEHRRRRPPIEIRDGVVIDRDLRVVSGHLKYDFEVVSPGTRFDLEVFVENPQPWWMGLLITGFDQLRDGFTAVGGFTSRGLGRVDIAWSEMREVTARGLLDGSPPRVVEKEALDREIASWRSALAAHASGGA